MFRLPSQSFCVSADSSTVCPAIVFRSSDFFDGSVVFGQLVVGETVGLGKVSPAVLVHRLGDVVGRCEKLVFSSYG